MTTRIPKHLRWLRPWLARGYTLPLRRSGHYHLRDPDGGYVATFSASPSDWRAQRQARTLLRRLEREARR